MNQPVLCLPLRLAVLAIGACGPPRPPPPVDPTPELRSLPSASQIEEIVLSRGGSCGRLADRTARCWGAWDGGLLKVSHPAAEISDLAELRVGHDLLEDSQQRYIDHFCVRDMHNAVRCWGNGHQGQLGVQGGESSPTPVSVEGLPPAIQLALGAHHACAITTAGAVLCWGSNEYGQLGIGKGEEKVPRPTQVQVPGKATQIVASNMDTCALTGEHEVYCWGENLRGEAGASNLTTRIAWTPHRVELASPSRQLSAAYSTLCALKLDGKIACWGYLTDQLGPGLDKATSGEVPEITDAVAIAVGYSHACAVRQDGTVWCWGRDEAGELGDGGSTGSRRPAPVSLPGRATQVAAGMRNSCARLEDRSWYCWGANRNGEIGPQGQAPITTPLPLDLSRVELAGE